MAFAAVEVAAGPFVLTLNVTSVDAAGRQLVGPFGETPRVVLRALNVTRECRDFVCAFNETLSFVNSTSILVNVSIYWVGGAGVREKPERGKRHSNQSDG
jgi:hypothetical protein